MGMPNAEWECRMPNECGMANDYGMAIKAASHSTFDILIRHPPLENSEFGNRQSAIDQRAA
jgi:hypothetical protein